MLNSSDREADFVLPRISSDDHWRLVLDTTFPEWTERTYGLFGQARYRAGGRSVVILKHGLAVPGKRRKQPARPRRPGARTTRRAEHRGEHAG